jgi:hypothetical protein
MEPEYIVAMSLIGLDRLNFGLFVRPDRHTLKAAMRPGLAAYLLALTSWITFVSMDVLQKHGHVLTADQAGAIFDQVTSIVIYLTVSCVTWWLGDRRVAKFLMCLKDGNLKNQTG